MTYQGNVPTKASGAPETILKPPRDMFEVPHPAGARRLSALSLLAPLVRT
jgi:hypothetical protein